MSNQVKFYELNSLDLRPKTAGSISFGTDSKGYGRMYVGGGTSDYLIGESVDKLAVGLSNTILSEYNSIAAGINHSVGSKGYYIWHLASAEEYDSNTNTYTGNMYTDISLSTSLTANVYPNPDIISQWKPGDTIVFVNDTRGEYEVLDFHIKEIIGNSTIRLDKDYNINKANVSNPGWDDFLIINVDRPEAGEVDFGRYTYAFGEGNKVLQRSSVVFGRDNRIVGEYSVVAGRQNHAGHASIVAGRNNKAYREFSAVFGSQNITYGKYNTALGGYNKITSTDAEYSTAIGDNNTIKSKQTMALGFSNTVSGAQSVAIGHGNTVESGQTLALVISGTVGSKITGTGIGNAIIGSNSTINTSASGNSLHTGSGKYNWILGGDECTISKNAHQCIVGGKLSTATGYRSVTLGESCSDGGYKNTTVFGQGNTACAHNQTIVGKYASTSASKAIFHVGTGTSSSRKSAFIVNSDNTIEVNGTLKVNGSTVTGGGTTIQKYEITSTDYNTIMSDQSGSSLGGYGDLEFSSKMDSFIHSVKNGVYALTINSNPVLIGVAHPDSSYDDCSILTIGTVVLYTDVDGGYTSGVKLDRY